MTQATPTEIFGLHCFSGSRILLIEISSILQGRCLKSHRLGQRHEKALLISHLGHLLSNDRKTDQTILETFDSSNSMSNVGVFAAICLSM